MRENCAYCGKSLIKYDSDGNRTTRVDAKFDSDACRDNYWSDIRKVQRAYNRAALAIDVLYIHGMKDNEVAGISNMLIDMMLERVQQSIDSD